MTQTHEEKKRKAREYAKWRYDNDAEYRQKVIARGVKWRRQDRKNHPEKYKASYQQYKKTREGIGWRQRQYDRYHNDPEYRARMLYLAKEWRARQKNVTPWMLHYNAALQRCQSTNSVISKNYKNKGIRFYLTETDVWILWKRDKGWLLEAPELDRINPRGDYIFHNCQFLEERDHARKGNEDQRGRAYA